MNAEVLNPQEFGIDPKQAKELISNLPQIKLERSELEKQFNEIIKMDIENPLTAKLASELRKLVKKNRTQGILTWHKTTKDYFLKGGQFVDAIKRKEIAINERMESDLEQIENYAEIQKQKKLDELEAKRKLIAEPYSEFIPFSIDLRNISDEDFEKIINGAKLQQQAKIETERKAEEERIKKEKLDKLEQERKYEIAPYVHFLNGSIELREMSNENYCLLISELKEAKINHDKEQEKIRKENERLKKEAEAEKLRQAKIEADRKSKEEKERKQREEEVKKEREAYEEQLRIQRAQQAKIEAELKEKKEAELKAERERIEAEEKAKIEAERKAKAPIKEKLNNWVDEMRLPYIDVENEATQEIQSKFASFKSWAKTQVKNL